jgi:hypothetical protein
MFLEIIERKNYREKSAQKKPQEEPVIKPAHKRTPHWRALLMRAREEAPGIWPAHSEGSPSTLAGERSQREDRNGRDDPMYIGQRTPSVNFVFIFSLQEWEGYMARCTITHVFGSQPQ